MILLLAVGLSIALAIARGGRLSRLGEVSFRLGWLALLAFALQLVIIYAPLPQNPGWQSPRVWLLLGSYVLLIAVVVANRKLPGFWLVALGLGLNLLAMLANGGYMPVTAEALQRAGLAQLALGAEPGARVVNSKDVLVAREWARLWILGDVLAIRWPLKTVFSIGDVFLAGGALIFFQRTMCPSSSDKNGEERIVIDSSQRSN